MLPHFDFCVISMHSVSNTFSVLCKSLCLFGNQRTMRFSDWAIYQAITPFRMWVWGYKVLLEQRQKSLVLCLKYRQDIQLKITIYLQFTSKCQSTQQFSIFLSEPQSSQCWEWQDITNYRLYCGASWPCLLLMPRVKQPKISILLYKDYTCVFNYSIFVRHIELLSVKCAL